MPSINLHYLARQRKAVERAILRAQYYEENGDVELLQSVITLIDELAELRDRFNADAARKRQRHN